MVLPFYIWPLVAVPILWLLKRRFFNAAVCRLHNRLDGKLVIVTGCNQGIGYETVGELARRGAQVIMACRDLTRAEEARQRLLERFGLEYNADHPYLTPIREDQLKCEKLDLESIQSIRSFASRMLNRNQPVHILVNNAGIDLKRAEYDANGIESQLKVNHLGPFLLTQLLCPLLQSAVGESRIVIVSSLRHRFATMNFQDLSHPVVGACYSNSKLANVIFAKELAKRWSSKGITAVSLHPGLVRTEIFKYHPWIRWIVHKPLCWFTKSPWEGAQTTLYCCLVKELIPGAYYADCDLATVNRQALQEGVGEQLWIASEQLVQKWTDGEKH
ncbi:Short-chain dehydrogenase [Paragonimus heterotremus]|uniref:Short-chain dehydrogenase n=1 Tax=Paragonimus heterotremus TaxID=100268 RepID=A0A8J4SSQ4_9TREM|nr:Short-chain dehydrogenase [Paragonimus heterotremus]